MIWWVILFVLGVLLGTICTMSQLGIVIAGVVLLFFWCLKIANKQKGAVLWGVGICFFVIGLVVTIGINEKIQRLEQLGNQKAIVEGTVIGVEQTATQNRYLVAVTKMDTDACRIKVICETDNAYEIGDVICVRATLRLFDVATNYGAFDERQYRYSNGIYLRLTQVETLRHGDNTESLRSRLYVIRQRMQTAYNYYLNETNASLASAMVLGDKTHLDAQIKELYQENGIAHLIAISGLHIAMIGGTLYHLVRTAIGRYDVSAGIGIMFIVFYGMMTGLVGASLRAMIMLVVMIGADVFGRKYDVLSAVALALFVMLLWKPYQIYQAGFLLSFGAVLGIALVVPVWNNLFEHTPKYLQGFVVSVCVQLTTLPIILWYYYEFPFWSVLLNVIVVPVMSVLLVCLLFCGIWGACVKAGQVAPGGLYEAIGMIFARISDGIFCFFEWLCKLSEKLPAHTICVGRPAWWCVFLYYGALVVFVFFSNRNQKNHKKKQQMAMIYGMLMIMLMLSMRIPRDLTVCMFDVGQGDGILIELPTRECILIDGGSSSEKQIGKYVLQNGIKYYGKNSVDYAVVTHSDQDHYSGIYQLIDEELIAVKCLILPKIANPDEQYQALEALARYHGISLRYMKQGNQLQIGNAKLTCLNPSEKIYADKNQGSLCLVLKYKQFDMLLTGDIDAETEQNIVWEQQMQLKGIDVLKVAHHGSATSSCLEFVKQMSPSIAVISVGKNNTYGHPAKETITNLKQVGAKVYRTDQNGAVQIRTDGYQIKVDCILNNR